MHLQCIPRITSKEWTPGSPYNNRSNFNCLMNLAAAIPVCNIQSTYSKPVSNPIKPDNQTYILRHTETTCFNRFRYLSFITNLYMLFWYWNGCKCFSSFSPTYLLPVSTDITEILFAGSVTRQLGIQNCPRNQV